MAKRCEHIWEPFVAVNTDGMDDSRKLQIAFLLALQRLNEYDRCTHCGRLSYIAKSRWGRRKLVSNDWLVERLLERRASFEKWLAERTALADNVAQLASLDAEDSGPAS